MTTNSPAAAVVSVLLVDSDPAFSGQAGEVIEKYNKSLDRQAGAVPPSGAGEASAYPHGGITLDTASTLQNAVSALQRADHHLVIANRQLPDGNGLELLPGSGHGHFPVLILSDENGEEPAVEAIKSGAIDYAVKSPETLANLPQLITAALYEWELMLEHQRMQLELIKLPQREQQRLGQELHDGVGQQLTGLGMLAQSLAKRLAGAAAREREMAEQLATGLEQALADVRHLSRGLLPVQMDAHGLVSALQELAARVSGQSGIKITLLHEAPLLITDNETATHVYRIIQEAINNVVKHAQAETITLLLEADDEKAVIEVRDDGKGLPDNVHAQRGLGLHSMFHRCQLFGGSLDIYTHEEGGTRVRCCFSLHPGKRVS